MTDLSRRRLCGERVPPPAHVSSRLDLIGTSTRRTAHNRVAITPRVTPRTRTTTASMTAHAVGSSITAGPRIPRSQAPRRSRRARRPRFGRPAETSRGTRRVARDRRAGAESRSVPEPVPVSCLFLSEPGPARCRRDCRTNTRRAAYRFRGPRAGGELERARRGREMRVREHVAPPNRPTEAVRAAQRGGKVRALFDGLVADLPTRRAADVGVFDTNRPRSEEYTSELQSRFDLVC